MNPRNGARAQDISLAQRARVAGSSLCVGLWALGCAAGVAPIEPDPATPRAAADPIAASVEVVVDHRPPLAIPATLASVFGTVTTDAQGRLSIASADALRNAEDEMYGWLIWVGPGTEPVRWTETLIGPDAGERDGESETGGSSASRPITFEGAMVPDAGFIYSQWVLGADEPPGRYRLVVALPGDRTEAFSFELGQPEDACPAMRILLNWWWAKYSLEGDPDNRDVTERVMEALGARLAHHGFVSADLQDAYWYVMASAARRNDDREVAYGHIVMRAIADFQGKARRYSSTTSKFEGLVDYGILFESPTSELDRFVRALADKFAAVLIPHARHACSDWWSGQREEEARLEAIRSELEAEILRVRERRAERAKRLELEVGP